MRFFVSPDFFVVVPVACVPFKSVAKVQNLVQEMLIGYHLVNRLGTDRVLIIIIIIIIIIVIIILLLFYYC